MAFQMITISRQFGAGGRDIGRALAERLSIRLYDKELASMIAERTELPLAYVESNGEYAAGRGFASFIAQRNGNGRSAQDEIWDAEVSIIKELAAKGKPCIFIGRSADYILRNEPDCLHVFIYADAKYRAEKAVSRGLREADPVKYIMERDKRRSIHCEFYTGRVWGRPENYHLMLDSGKLSEAFCTELITRAFEKE